MLVRGLSVVPVVIHDGHTTMLGDIAAIRLHLQLVGQTVQVGRALEAIAAYERGRVQRRVDHTERLRLTTRGTRGTYEAGRRLHM